MRSNTRRSSSLLTLCVIAIGAVLPASAFAGAGIDRLKREVSRLRQKRQYLSGGETPDWGNRVMRLQMLRVAEAAVKLPLPTLRRISDSLHAGVAAVGLTHPEVRATRDRATPAPRGVSHGLWKELMAHFDGASGLVRTIEKHRDLSMEDFAAGLRDKGFSDVDMPTARALWKYAQARFGHSRLRMFYRTLVEQRVDLDD